MVQWYFVLYDVVVYDYVSVAALLTFEKKYHYHYVNHSIFNYFSTVMPK